MLKKYDIFDLVKFLASLAIIAIHSNVFIDISPKLNYYICGGLFRLAVPLFFLITAFFYFNNELSVINLKKYCFRLIKLYICWFIITFPITFYDRFIIGCESKNIKVFLFVRSIFFSSTFGGSWFLASCIFCALFFYFVEKIKNNLRNIIIIIVSVLSYLWCVVTSAYGEWLNGWIVTKNIYLMYELIFCKPYTSILVGVPYFAIIRYLVYKQVKFNSLVLLGVSFILFIMELFFVSKMKLIHTTDCYFMLMPCALLIFLAIIKIRIHINVSKMLRIMSTLIYFSHFIWLFMLEFAEWAIGTTITHIAKFVIASIITIMFSYSIYYLGETKSILIVKKLY